MGLGWWPQADFSGAVISRLDPESLASQAILNEHTFRYHVAGEEEVLVWVSVLALADICDHGQGICISESLFSHQEKEVRLANDLQFFFLSAEPETQSWAVIKSCLFALPLP